MDDVEVERDLSVVAYEHNLLAGSPSVPEESMESEVSPGTPAPVMEAPQVTAISKAAFILGLPKHFTAKEAVEEAKQHGIDVATEYVYKVRAKAAAAAPASAKPVTQKPAVVPKAATVSKAATASKTAFVRSLPSGMSYADAAAKAKEAGISISKAHFYVLKNQINTPVPEAAKSKPTPRPVVQAKPSLAGLRLASDDAREQALIDAIRELGVAQSRAVFDIVEKFERVIE